MLRSLFKDSVIYTIPMFLTYGVNFFLLPLYTRVLSPSDYGAIDMLKAFESFVLLVIAMEVSQGLALFFTKEKDPLKKSQYFSSAFWFTLACHSVFLIIGFIFQKQITIAIFGSLDLQPILQIGLVYITINCIFHLINCHFRFDFKSTKFVISSLISFFCTALSSLYFAYVSKLGLMGMVLGLLIGSSCGVLYGIVSLRKKIIFQIDIQKLKEMLIFSLPLVPASALVFVNSYVDRVMINHFLSLTEVGLYGMGFRIASIVSLLLVGFNKALVPSIIKHHDHPETPNNLATLFKLFVVASLFFTFSLTILAPDILAILTTPSFYEAKKTVIFLVPAILLSQMYIFVPGLSLSKKTGLILVTSIICALINALMNILLIPFFGYVGASLSTFLAQGLGFAIQVILSQKYYHVPLDVRSLFIPSIVVFLIAYICSNALGIGFGLKALIISLFPLILLGSGTYKINELKFFYTKIIAFLKTRS